ncbi:MAG: hypothetical protein ACM37U_05100 [Gemmatimonas sp.]
MVLGALGKREAELGETPMNAGERRTGRRQALRVVMQASLIAGAAAAVAWLL